MQQPLLSLEGKLPTAKSLAVTSLMSLFFSDTVASSLTFLFYYLAKYPDEAKTLRTELLASERHLNFSMLETCSHLNGFISKTLRLHPPVPSGVLRNTPSEGLMIRGRYIPGDTTVLIPMYTLGRRMTTIPYTERIDNSAACRVVTLTSFEFGI